MKELIALPAIILLLIARVGFSQSVPDVEKRMDSLFAHYNTHTPGVSIVVVKDGKTVFKKSYGSANLEHGIANTPQTAFQIASVSKQFTAFAIYLLAKEGRLSVEDDVRKYIPELPPYGKIIRIRHLLAHTSGIRDLAATLTLAGWHIEDVMTTEQILKVITRQNELNFEPGSAFGYSNTGYTLLAQIVERITKQSFTDYTSKNIFEPLQMTNTRFYNDYHTIIKNRAHSYEKKNGQYIKSELLVADAGPSSLHTTAEDLAKWANNFDHPVVGDIQLISAFNQVSVLDNNKPVVWAASATDTTYHAKGQVRWQHRGIPVISHGGHTAGYRAWLGRFPEHNLSIIALSNDEHYDILGTGLKIVEFYLKDQFTETPTMHSLPSPININKTEKYTVTLRDFIGYYYSDELATGYSVNLQNDKLIMTHSRLSDIELTRIGDSKFTGINSFKFEIEFVRKGRNIIGFRISNFGAKNVRFFKTTNDDVRH
jgi:CubicO group peptidase (beta-lactamase class C family)